MTELAYLATRNIGQFPEQRRNKLRTRLVESRPPSNSGKLLLLWSWTGNGASNSSPRSMNYQQMKLSVCGRSRPGAIQSDALTLRTFAIRLVSITAASLRFPSEFATVMVIDAKRNANFRGRLKNCQ